jgi:hypothetical protein
VFRSTKLAEVAAQDRNRRAKPVPLGGTPPTRIGEPNSSLLSLSAALTIECPSRGSLMAMAKDDGVAGSGAGAVRHHEPDGKC